MDLDWAVAMQMSPGGATLSPPALCVCVCFGLPAVMDRCPLYQGPWQLPRWLTQIDAVSEDGRTHTRAFPLIRTRTHCVDLRGPQHREARPIRAGEGGKKRF